MGSLSLQQVAKAVKAAVISSSRGIQHPNVEAVDLYDQVFLSGESYETVALAHDVYSKFAGGFEGSFADADVFCKCAESDVIFAVITLPHDIVAMRANW